MASPFELFFTNLTDTQRLLEIHQQLGGDGPGRRHRLEALNKSAIVLMCAAFEAFIETLATQSFSSLVDETHDPGHLPDTLRRAVAEKLKASPHHLQVWDLAGDGWKAACTAHKQQAIEQYTAKMNTPKAGQIDELFKKLLGIPDFSDGWGWHNMPSQRCKDKLRRFVELRGAIAHGEQPAPRVQRNHAIIYLNFLGYLTACCNNLMRDWCHQATGVYPWEPAVYLPV